MAQSGSAPALGAGCREFESLYPDYYQSDQSDQPHQSCERHSCLFQDPHSSDHFQSLSLAELAKHESSKHSCCFYEIRSIEQYQLNIYAPCMPPRTLPSKQHSRVWPTALQ